MKKQTLLITALFTLAIFSNALAVDWTDSVGTHLWSDSDNWYPWSPDEMEVATINKTDPNVCIIDSATTAVAAAAQIGFWLPGHLKITGGTLNCGDFRAGSDGGGDGLVTVSGGAVTLTADSVVGQFSGLGTFEMTGGTVNHTSGSFFVGYNGGVGNLNIIDSSATFTTRSLRIGYEGGNGTVTISDGNLIITGDASIGQNMSSIGTLNIDGGIVNQTAGWLYIGYQQGIGTVNLNGGLLSTPHIELGSVAGGAYAPVPLIDLRGGTLEIRDARPADIEYQVLSYYVPRGWIKAYGGEGTVSLTQDTDTGWMIVEGVPPCWWDLPGDVDHNCTVDLTDFAALANDWLVTVE